MRVAGLLSAAIAAAAGPANGDTGFVDPSHGRVAGDLGVAVGAGAVVAPRGPRAVADLRLRYLETAGLYLSYEEASALGSASEPSRVLAAGVELRPLFFFRWLQGHEVDGARLDLTLDSIGLLLGATFGQPVGSGFGSSRGLEVGLGVELPVLESTVGPWIGLRGALRWSERSFESGPVALEDRQAVLVMTVSWHALVAAHLVDVGDEAPK